ncbi:hypothetical protein [Parapedobacter sp. 2B3]|uniref:hypothetical protein n=1 Tax=Parapedobacter sp. 2B3 TaxID=3342381 RepID=UPI0035B5B0A2
MKRKLSDRFYRLFFTQVFASVLFIALTFAANFYLHRNTQVMAAVVVGGCQIGACYGYCYLIRRWFDQQKSRRAFRGILLLSVLLPLSAPLLIYQVFPVLGVKLWKEGAAFQWGELAVNVFLALKTVWIVAAIYFYFYRERMSQRKVYALRQQAAEKEIEQQQAKINRLLSMMQSHYIRRVLMGIVGRAESAGEPYIAAQAIHIRKTIDYVAEAIRDHAAVISIQQALAYFEEVAVSVRLRNGGDKALVHVHYDGIPTMQVIGALTLPTLLENGDTHGWVNLDHPIRVAFVFREGYLRFTCTNAKDPEGKQVASTGQGHALVREELALLSRHEVDLTVAEDAETYEVCLTITYQ